MLPREHEEHTVSNPLTRRTFIRTAAAGSAALTALGARRGPIVFAAQAGKPALLGGTPVHPGGWAKWPQWRETWEPEVLRVFRSGRWYRASGDLAGATKICVATDAAQWGGSALSGSVRILDPEEVLHAS